ncbi:TIGR03086 family metal-binding protein [Kitasatospora cathayae]|uniref:TIGR03086 family metal-binding protein n=1 Tax=Kitasatospora cathayae TaxID=3004092 RepID=A0ABY7PYS9_9ACTN|nr:TIGR03086 family metal-binding protein [Kitasatospora sp. HUAS 3-15]WBP85372.1 TIGR03086 family metal-binding protein [Kitasatospora sp. HUAS 3-15]
MTVDDPIELLARALAQTAGLIDGTGVELAGHPTPCRSWDVGDLVSHLLFDLRQFTLRAEGGQPDWSQSFERVEEDWLHAFEAGAERLVDAWRAAGDLTGTVKTPGGTVPARFPVDQQTAEFAVHAWDLAHATGQSTEGLDHQVAFAALDWARGALRPEYRGDEADQHAFGPEVPAPADAPAYDRLAAFFGRDPWAGSGS